MEPDRVWSDRPIVAAARTGVAAGAVFGVFELLMTGSAVKALAAGVFFGVFFAGFLTWFMRRQGRRSADLAPGDRAAVARAVRLGEDIGDDRLAGAVVEYAAVVRRANERDARWNWVLVVFAVGSLIGAVTSTLGGVTGEAVVFWVCTAFWTVALGWLFPRRRARALANAQRAEQAARSRLAASGPV